VTALLRVEGLAVEADGYERLVEVDLAVPEHGLHLVLGAAGAGKSALIEAVATGAGVRRGRLFHRDDEITRSSAVSRRRRGLAAAFQTPALCPGLTLDEHLAMSAADNAGSLALDTLFRVVPELEGARRLPVDRLDRPRRRLADLARALASRPELLLVDDAALDLGVPRTLELLEALKRLGLTLLVADRYARPLLPLAGTASVLARGRTVLAGAASELIHDERVLMASVGEDPA